MPDARGWGGSEQAGFDAELRLHWILNNWGVQMPEGLVCKEYLNMLHMET